MFDIKISVITSERQTLKSKLNLVNAIFKKTFGLALKGECVRTGGTNNFTLQLMNCFTYVNGTMTLKLPSGKLIKSHLNRPWFFFLFSQGHPHINIVAARASCLGVLVAGDQLFQIYKRVGKVDHQL